jgi:hypothetical protein
MYSGVLVLVLMPVNGNAEMYRAAGERKWKLELDDLWKKRW